jgi:hypothetical protein
MGAARRIERRDRKLSPAEIAAATRARYFSISGWGRDGDLDPAGMVARLRGVRFIGTGFLLPHPDDEYDAATAMEDVAAWLGLESANEYLRTLTMDREAIFKRARY